METDRKKANTSYEAIQNPVFPATGAIMIKPALLAKRNFNNWPAYLGSPGEKASAVEVITVVFQSYHD